MRLQVLLINHKPASGGEGTHIHLQRAYESIINAQCSWLTGRVNRQAVYCSACPYKGNEPGAPVGTHRGGVWSPGLQSRHDKYLGQKHSGLFELYRCLQFCTRLYFVMFRVLIHNLVTPSFISHHRKKPSFHKRQTLRE